MHASVLLQETIDGLEPKPGQTIIDGTLGNGGHTAAICEQFGRGVRVIALDLDRESIARATERLSNLGCDVTMREANFRNLDTVLAELGISGVDGILLDLGWSMDQFTSSGRGFSFRQDEPLSMMLKAEKGEADFDAADIVNGWKEEDIANVIYGYGEERFARHRRARRTHLLLDQPHASGDQDVPSAPHCGQRRIGEPFRSPGQRLPCLEPGRTDGDHQFP